MTLGEMIDTAVRANNALIVELYKVAGMAPLLRALGLEVAPDVDAQVAEIKDEIFGYTAFSRALAENENVDDGE